MTGEWDSKGEPSIAIFDDTGNSDALCVAASLATEMIAGFGPRDERPFSIVARSGEGLVGGLTGATHWSWCYIRQLWVKEDWRRRKLGRRLLAEAENHAKGRHCVGLYVDTFDPGAARFYERSGFERFGVIEGFPPGHSRIFLMRRLGL